MSKGGGQGSFAQMQGAENQYGSPQLEAMEIGDFGGGGPQPAFANQIMPVGNSQNFSSGIGGKGGQLAPQNQGPGSYMGNELVPLDRNLSMMTGDRIASDITGFIPGGGNSSTRTNDVIGGDGLLYQLQPIDQPVPNPQPQPRLGIGDPSNPMLQDLRPLPLAGGFEGAMSRFNNLTTSQRERLGDLGIDDIFGSGAQRVTNVQTQGPESMPRLEELLRMNEVSGPARPDPAPRRTSRYTEADYSAAEAQAREILGLPPKGGGRVYAGGTPNFDERTGEYRTGGIKPPRATGDSGVRTMEFIDANNNGIDDRDDFRPSAPASGGRSGRFGNAIRELRDEFRPQPMPRRQPPIFGPPRNFPFPMPRPPSMPPRQPPRMPGRNTQFQMPFFGSPYGQMNPYAGQFSGYGVPSNMMSFAQPHYQAYTPRSFAPPQQTRYTPTAPPTMQLPPGMGAPTFGGGYGGIGGFGRYNLGLAGSQLF